MASPYIDGNTRVKDARDEDSIEAIARVTNLTTATIRKKLASSHGATILRYVFDWPVRADEIGMWSATFALEREAGSEIAELVGLPMTKVNVRLTEATGKMLVKNVFSQEWPSSEFDLDTMGETTASAALNDASFSAARNEWLDSLANALNISPQTVRRRIAGANGRTLLRSIFKKEWPLSWEETLAHLKGVTVADALADKEWISWIAKAFELTQRSVRDQLESATAKRLVLDIFGKTEVPLEQASRKPTDTHSVSSPETPPNNQKVSESEKLAPNQRRSHQGASRPTELRPDNPVEAEVQPKSEMFRHYDLHAARKAPSRRVAAPHQTESLEKLGAWFRSRPAGDRGGILVLPTGGGKTFTTVRFLCQEPLSDGYKVLWLAHTHHLLEQAIDAFGPLDIKKGSIEVGEIHEPRMQLDVRVVSGTTGHFPPAQIEESDDVVIATLQTASNAWDRQHPRLKAFLDSAGGKLLVVFDEAHHAPAPSYSRLIQNLRMAYPGTYLLGLTATPEYSDERRAGWLKRLFPQGILASVSRSRLIAAGVLSKPHFENANTNITMELDEGDYHRWLATSGDLPESIVNEMARNHKRNDFIVATYVNNKEKYGKTLLFADRWHQCDYLAEGLKSAGIRADVVYSHVETSGGSADERNRRTKDSNAQALHQFREGNLDVLVNVRMLTEGTDVPNVKSVFVTRQTTSGVLLTQMIGRALRGPLFGGTEDAHIVSFIDNWKQVISFADYEALPVGRADEGASEYAKRPPLQLISIELVRRLARAMHTGIAGASQAFVTMLPVGWYAVEYPTATGANADDTLWTRQLVMVFASEQERYAAFVKHLCSESLTAFLDEKVSLGAQRSTLESWAARFFPDAEEHPGTDLIHNLFVITRHMAQTPGEAVPFFAFAERNAHDLDAIAQTMIEHDLGPRALDEALSAEFRRVDRFWRSLYSNYGLFYSQYQTVQRRVLDAKLHGSSSESFAAPIVTTPQSRAPDEPSQAVKDSVFRRDNRSCCCCGSSHRLQIDHIVPRYLGGSHDMDQLQTLCRECNGSKNINEMNFRTSGTPLQVSPSWTRLDLPADVDLDEASIWEQYIRRSVNFFYQCAAVDTLQMDSTVGDGSAWRVRLRPGNIPDWFGGHVDDWLRYVNGVRSGAGLSPVPSIQIVSVS